MLALAVDVELSILIHTMVKLYLVQMKEYENFLVMLGVGIDGSIYKIMPLIFTSLIKQYFSNRAANPLLGLHCHESLPDPEPHDLPHLRRTAPIPNHEQYHD